MRLALLCILCIPCRPILTPHEERVSLSLNTSARYGINLPTWAGLTREDVRYVCDSLLECCVTPKPLVSVCSVCPFAELRSLRLGLAQQTISAYYVLQGFSPAKRLHRRALCSSIDLSIEYWSTLNMKRLLVTGSNGLIGSEMVRHFHDLGWEVHGVDNNMRADFFGPQGDTRWNQQRLLQQFPRFTHHELDVRDRPGVLALVKQLQTRRRDSHGCPAQPRSGRQAPV